MITVQTEKTRIEHDLLGAKEVPADSYYGIHTLRALENFQISNQQVGENLHFIRALAQVKRHLRKPIYSLRKSPRRWLRRFSMPVTS